MCWAIPFSGGPVRRSTGLKRRNRNTCRPSPATSGSSSGYYYRYYSGTNSYVGTRDGNAYFMGPDGVIQYMGTLASNGVRALIAGY